jgi:hypothetical protein
MKTSFMKLLTSAIILLFIGITYAPSITADNPISVKTIYIDDDGRADYTRIQDAVLIDNSMEQKEIYPNDAELEIVILENMSFIIRNIGDADAISVTWEKYLSSWLLILGSGTKTGIIEMIPVGSEEIIVGNEQPVFLFGFGPLNLLVTASAENAEEVTVSGNIGFLLGVLVIPNGDVI